MIAVCVCTYHRPDGLRYLLSRLAAIDTEQDLTIIVADNSPDGEGLAVCAEFAQNYRWALLSVAELRNGISYAANAAAAKALSIKPAFIAFLDDDEWPDPQWLAQLLRVQSENNADVVGGPTLPVFPDNTSAICLHSGYYGADMKLARGTPCRLYAGGNFLIKAEVLEALSPQFFDPQYAQTGGQDLAFFMTLAKKGYSMYWAPDAKVYEKVPAHRATEDWLKNRVQLIANSRVHITARLEPGFLPTTVRVVKTTGLGIISFFTAMMGLYSARRHEQAVLLWHKCLGKLKAHCGIKLYRNEGH